MINRRNLWFLTLFSLILILGVYYVTLPSDIFKNSSTLKVNEQIDVKVTESDKLIALRVERDEKVETVMKELQNKITSPNISAEERNAAFEELQILNLAKGRETMLEDKIFDNFKIKSFAEIDNDNIKVTINSKEHNTNLANNIMRSIQEEFTEKKYITIKFES
jgi:stage III sporulation protein AH